MANYLFISFVVRRIRGEVLVVVGVLIDSVTKWVRQWLQTS